MSGWTVDWLVNAGVAAAYFSLAFLVMYVAGVRRDDPLRATLFFVGLFLALEAASNAVEAMDARAQGFIVAFKLAAALVAVWLCVSVLVRLRMIVRMPSPLCDPLTGLDNHTTFVQRLSEAINDRRRPPLAVLYVDMDAFKAANDRLGHASGDEVLRHAAARLRRSVKEGDAVARLGGDEFGILLKGVDDPGVAEATALRVLEAFREPFTLASGERVSSTVSVGIAYANGSNTATSAPMLMDRADAAMYAAKLAGKDRFATG